MMEPKDGEVWLVASNYSWGWCIIEIEETHYERLFRGIVVAVENEDDFNRTRDGAAFRNNGNWTFRKKDFVKRLEKKGGENG